MRSSPGLITLLAFLLVASPAPAESADKIKDAIKRGLRRIEQGADAYPKQRVCFSCHHQALPILSLVAAEKRGFKVDAGRIKRYADFSLKSFRKKEAIVKGQGIPGSNTTAAYALTALEAAGHAPDETTAALVEFLLVRQRPDGSWPAVTQRPPSEGSAFTNTALVLASLKRYGPAQGKLPERIQAAHDKGRRWLIEQRPRTTEDKVFRLRGLLHAAADAGEIAASRELLLKEQQPDGSWAQMPDRPGDAYATGSALVTLRAAGLPASSPAYERGVKFLLSKQEPDGSWLVQTRSKPVQVFFDNGDPGGKSQFISFSATNWAVLALLETIAPALAKLPGDSAPEEQPKGEKQTKIVLVAGANFFKPGEHEYKAGCAVLADLLRQTPGITPVLAVDWPKDPETFRDARAVVFFFDGGDKHGLLKGDRLARVQKLADAGVGIVHLHQVIDYPKDLGERARGWMGAAWEKGFSQRAHWVAKVDTFPDHPICRAVKPFTIDDGWLYKLRFNKGMKGITPLLRTVSPKAKEKGADSDAIISWAYQRPGGGRSFTFTGGHLHKSFAEEGYRRFLVQGILWTASVDIPATGAPVVLDPSTLGKYLKAR